VALPFRTRQCRRSTSATITALACFRSGVSVGRVPAVFPACRSRMAMWHQSTNGGVVTPASARIERSPEQLSVKAVSSVSVVWPTSEAAPDQRLNRGVSFGDRSENQAGSVRRLDIAEADFQVPLTRLTAPDEGGVQTEGDRRGCDRRVGRGGVDQVRADLERAGAQGLGVDPGIDRQKVSGHAGRDPVRQAGGKLRPDLIELGRRAAVRRPTDTSLRPPQPAQRKRGSRSAT
jgi:hypothetical protein